jgi:hypothetical protein
VCVFFILRNTQLHALASPAKAGVSILESTPNALVGCLQGLCAVMTLVALRGLSRWTHNPGQIWKSVRGRLVFGFYSLPSKEGNQLAPVCLPSAGCRSPIKKWRLFISDGLPLAVKPSTVAVLLRNGAVLCIHSHASIHKHFTDMEIGVTARCELIYPYRCWQCSYSRGAVQGWSKKGPKSSSWAMMIGCQQYNIVQTPYVLVVRGYESNTT